MVKAPLRVSVVETGVYSAILATQERPSEAGGSRLLIELCLPGREQDRYLAHQGYQVRSPT